MDVRLPESCQVYRLVTTGLCLQVPCGQMVDMSEITDSRGALDMRASLAIAGGAAMWGLFWIPLRYVADAGLGPMWAAALTLCGGLPFAFMAMLLFARKDRGQWPWMVVFGLGMGVSATLYFVSVIMTDVVRAIFLFYMLPIWTTLFDRLVFGIRLDIARAFAVIIAFAGLWLLLGGDGGVPLPRNAGDWAALGAGFSWGITLSLVRARPAVDPHKSVFSSVLFASILSLVAAVMMTGGGPELPQISGEVLLVIIAFGALALWPSMIGQLWGARLVPATRAALLTMTEIVVATGTAALLIGTTLTSVSIIGGFVIVAAVVLDLLWAKNHS